jgi:hypothetical protein
MIAKANRHKYIDNKQEQFINARITTPQTYDQIKEKGQAKILKIASRGIVEKLLKRCEMYKGIIGKKTETIKSKNELIGMLAGRLQTHEPDLFKQDFKELAEAVEQAQQEKVETGIEKGKQELTEEEKKEVETDNDNLDNDDIDIDDELDNAPECGEGGDGSEDDIEDDPEPNDDKDDETPED